MVLAGASKYLYYNADPTEVGVWTTRTISLAESGWRLDDWQGSDATADDMREVLSDLRGLYINAEWRTGPDDTLLDNVYLDTGAVLAGDLNCDGVLDNFDIDPFVLALTDPDTYHAQFPDCDIMNADCNGDGELDNFDIDPFVELLSGG